MLFCLEKIEEIENIVNMSDIFISKEFVMKEKIFNVEGMSCNHCVMAVTNAVKRVEGVADVSVDLEKGTAKVVCADDTVDGDIVEAIEEEGFTVS